MYHEILRDFYFWREHLATWFLSLPVTLYQPLLLNDTWPCQQAFSLWKGASGRSQMWFTFLRPMPRTQRSPHKGDMEECRGFVHFLKADVLIWYLSVSWHTVLIGTFFSSDVALSLFRGLGELMNGLTSSVFFLCWQNPSGYLESNGFGEVHFHFKKHFIGHNAYGYACEYMSSQSHWCLLYNSSKVKNHC